MMRRLVLPLVLPLLGVLGWWWFTRTGDSFYYPPLSEVIDRFSVNWFDERWESDLLPSLRRIAIGWTAASLIGIVAGLVLGTSTVLRRLLDPLVNFIRSIPSAALVPFAIVAFGIGDTGKIFLITFVCIWPVLLNAMDGVDEVHSTQVNTARAFRISWVRRMWSISLPSAAPRIATGMSSALSLAVIVMLISEMVASTHGIGYFTIQAQRTFQVADMWSGILMLAVLGFVLNFIFRLTERRVLAWHFDSKKLP